MDEEGEEAGSHLLVGVGEVAGRLRRSGWRFPAPGGGRSKATDPEENPRSELDRGEGRVRPYGEGNSFSFDAATRSGWAVQTA